MLSAHFYPRRGAAGYVVELPHTVTPAPGSDPQRSGTTRCSPSTVCVDTQDYVARLGVLSEKERHVACSIGLRDFLQAELVASAEAHPVDPLNIRGKLRGRD